MAHTINQGVRIHYTVEGSGPPLVLQHGFTDSLDTWYEWGYVDALRHDYQLILIDARGHGRSGKPHDPEAYGMQSFAFDVVAVLQAEQVSRCHFMGYSMGGRIAVAMAKYAPEWLYSLIIGGWHPFQGAQESQSLQKRIELLATGPQSTLSMWDTALSPALRERLLQNDTEAFIALTTRRIKDETGVEDLPAVKVPCLFLNGEADKGYRVLKETLDRNPKHGSTIVSLQGLKHMETLYNRDLVLSHVLPFLNAACRNPGQTNRQ